MVCLTTEGSEVFTENRDIYINEHDEKRTNVKECDATEVEERTGVRYKNNSIQYVHYQPG